MKRLIGTSAMGIRAPIIKEDDDLVKITSDLILQTVENYNLNFKDKDIVAVTESLLARAQGNFCDIQEISDEINEKFGDSIGVLFPITSRNRFSVILKAIADTGKDVYVFLNYPSDEVGNEIIEGEILAQEGINSYIETIDEERYRELVGGSYHHPFTGVDYVELYKSMGKGNIKIFLSNNPLDLLNYTDEILVAGVHERVYLEEIMKANGAKTVYTLADLLTEPRNGSGYNPQYGLYGSNMSTETELKLFPRDCQEFVDELQKNIYDRTGVTIEAMIYGDGAFKDPVAGIWELADPVVSPAYTSGLEGRPKEIKLKFVADNELRDMTHEEAQRAIKEKIANKTEDNIEQGSIGTTPRQIPDLLGSLADLVSGSGDKGTPIVFIQGYFDNYSDQ